MMALIDLRTRYLAVFLSFCSGLCGQYLPADHYKVRTVEATLQRLTDAIGDYRRPPELRMSRSGDAGETIARIKWNPVPVLYLDERVYDLCVLTFGADSLHALSTVIGHEVAHYYRNHRNMAGFALPEKVQGLEAEADEWGLFAAGLAGFAGGEFFPEVIEAIYREYRLEDQLDRYVEKDVRIRMAREQLAGLAPFRHVFEAGQLLYLFGHYLEAARCYDFVLQRFPSREIYNNAAVIELINALELMDPLECLFALPVELDPVSRLPRTGSRAVGPGEAAAAERLRQAAGLLEKVKALDPAYAPGYINLACARLLQGNYPAAAGLMIELEAKMEALNRPVPADAHTVRAIALVLDGQLTKAAPFFEQARERGARLGDVNQLLFERIRRSGLDTLSGLSRTDTLYALKGWTENLVSAYREEESHAEERQAGGIGFAELRRAGVAHTFRLPGSPPLKVLVADVPPGTGLRVLRPSPTDPDIDEVLDFITTSQGTTAKGIGAGATLESVVAAYGRPGIDQAGAAGRRFFYYDSADLLFHFLDGRVQAWTIYRRQPYLR
jgi:tetratricopeptide (TPR) repeat protein